VAKGSKDQALSTRLPVARVAVDISLAHLDRPFDYLVPASMDEAAVPGCRVRVRFAGQLVDGYLLDRADSSEHQGRLARLERVTSPEPVLTPEIFDLRPRAIIAALDLLRPIYAQTSAYGHFGRSEPDFSWERADRADQLRAAAGL